MKIKISVNGSTKEVAGDKNLEQLVRSLVEKNRGLIVELNKKIINRNHWRDHILQEGDVVELISFVGGG